MFNVLLKLPKSMTQMYNKELNKIEIYQFYIILHIQGNLGLTNLKGTKILFFIAGVLLLVWFFTIDLTTEGLEIMFFIAGILLLRGSLYQGSSVC
jgi:hypothetical protein